MKLHSQDLYIFMCWRCWNPIDVQAKKLLAKQNSLSEVNNAVKDAVSYLNLMMKTAFFYGRSHFSIWTKFNHIIMQKGEMMPTLLTTL